VQRPTVGVPSPQEAVRISFYLRAQRRPPQCANLLRTGVGAPGRIHARRATAADARRLRGRIGVTRQRGELRERYGRGLEAYRTSPTAIFWSKLAHIGESRYSHRTAAYVAIAKKTSARVSNFVDGLGAMGGVSTRFSSAHHHTAAGMPCTSRRPPGFRQSTGGCGACAARDAEDRVWPPERVPAPIESRDAPSR
jgi:hypothetical protein